MGLMDAPAKRRWARTDRFVLSAAGVEAEARYRSNIGEARNEGGRASFEAARAAWATSLGVDPEDGACLGELGAGPVSLGRLVEAMEATGHTRGQALEGLGRLWDAGLVCAWVKP